MKMHERKSVGIDNSLIAGQFGTCDFDIERIIEEPWLREEISPADGGVVKDGHELLLYYLPKCFSRS